jgi:hypothetical protein
MDVSALATGFEMKGDSTAGRPDADLVRELPWEER